MVMTPDNYSFEKDCLKQVDPEFGVVVSVWPLTPEQIERFVKLITEVTGSYEL
jgi:hypothetical protein